MFFSLNNHCWNKNPCFYLNFQVQLLKPPFLCRTKLKDSFPSRRCRLSRRPGPLRGAVQLLHLPGGVRGARLHAMRPQLLQGLPAGLLEPQQEVHLPHVQEELLQEARDERQQGSGRDLLAVPGAGGGRRRRRLTGLHAEPELRFRSSGLCGARHRGVCQTWGGALRRLHWEETEGAQVLCELPGVVLREPPQTSQKGQPVSPPSQ